MTKVPVYTVISVLFTIIFISSCSDEDLYRGKINNGDELNPNEDTSYIYTPYIYPYGNEVKNPIAEITIVTDGKTDLSSAQIEIPALKYNKSWLFVLTQDDCMQSAFCRTWAAINGKPISTIYNDTNLFYDIEHLAADDLPPAHYYLDKTLGSSDGCGNEVRFHFTTTLSPEWDYMNATTVVKKGFTDNYYRFYMKSGLRWSNIFEMLNYDTGIAFHDVNTVYIEDATSILQHYQIAQDSIIKRLSGRGSKMLAEPNGNKTYITAAYKYPDIQTITAQSDAEKLYPFKVSTDLQQTVISRIFKDNPEDIKNIIQEQMLIAKEDRAAVCIGVHNTGDEWVNLLYWLNNTYGKDGDDSVWFPSQEEYYEYNYYRIHAEQNITIDNNTVKIRIEIPTEKHFLYPSLTINIKNIDPIHIQSVTSNDAVTSMSHGAHDGMLMINLDCRKYLTERAEHYVEIYEKNPNSQNLSDAKYFVNQLKESTIKDDLVKRLNM